MQHSFSNKDKVENESDVTSMLTAALKLAREMTSNSQSSSTDGQKFLETAKVREIINDSVQAEQNETKCKINEMLTRWIKLDEIVLSDLVEILISHDVSPLALFMTNSCLDFNKICDFLTQSPNSFDGGMYYFVL